MDLYSVFKALGHEVRFQIVKMLLYGTIHSCCGEIRSYEQGCCITDLTNQFDLSQSTLSHHMNILMKAGIVYMEKRGSWSVYFLSVDTLRELNQGIVSWIELFDQKPNEACSIKEQNQ